jgi:hypothetical protein
MGGSGLGVWVWEVEYFVMKALPETGIDDASNATLLVRSFLVRMEQMFQYIQTLSASMGQPPPPELFPPPPALATTPVSLPSLP